MKIKSDMKTNYLKHYNESRGIALNRKKILKTNTNKVPTAFQCFIITTLILIIPTILFFIIDKSKIVFILFLVMTTIYIIYEILRTIWSYNFKKKSNFINEITIDESGIIDSSFYGITINIKPENIKAIVIKRNTVTILTHISIYFFFNIKEKDIIINEIKKYNKDIKIIE